MNRLGAAVLVGLVLGSASAPSILSPRPAAEAQSPDARQRLSLPTAGRDKILAEMRAMLEALNGVLHALTTGDRAAAERAARAAGMATAADVDPEIKKRLPPAFLQLGMQTHTSFDRVANRLRAGASVDETLRNLAGLTANCVACHAAFRLDEAW
jgi:cytochrome c556